MTANNPSDIIDLRKVFRKIWNRKKLFVKTLSFTFFIACLYILPLPRYYNCNITLAPEMENSASGGSLGSLASSFGINLNSAGSTDAIPPVLYPDLMEASDFMVSLFPIKVVSEDGLISTDYYTYIKKHQKTNLWLRPFKWIKKTIASLFTKNEATSSNGHKVDPFKLSKEQQDVVSTMKNHISCDVDKKTDVITITVQEQDPLICATMADSIRTRLQNFITDYRTNKARIDLDYYTKLTIDAKRDYERARQLYASFSDSNVDVILQSYKAKQDDLENDMQIKFNTYNALNTQLQAAKAKVQEKTPAFTIIQGASVPIKPAGPKRMFFVLAMMFMAFILTIGYILKDDILTPLMQK